MDLTVIIPSRGRVGGLTAALATLRGLEGGRHRVVYGVCCDEDDFATRAFCAGHQAEHPDSFAYRVGPRPASLGGVINDMATRLPGDVYLALTDHCLCLTPGWDDVVAKAVEETPHGVFFWTCAWPRIDAHYCIITEKWRAAAGGLMSEDYPFWFDDLALLELYPMATGQGARHLDVEIAYTRTKTHRMRDLKFWRDFFAFNRAARVEKGKEVAAKLGLPAPEFGAAFAAGLDELLPKAPDEHLAYIESLQGDPGDPDPVYLEAKARAERIMQPPTKE